MRLLKPSPGEAVDRQTILELKIKYGSQGADENMTMESMDKDESGLVRFKMDNPSKVNIEPFLEENEQIQKYLEKNWFPDLPPAKGVEYDKQLEELANLNEQIWKLTDRAHVLTEAINRTDEIIQRAAEVMFLITELNDKRAVVVQKINRLFNINMQEKIFA